MLSRRQRKFFRWAKPQPKRLPKDIRIRRIHPKEGARPSQRISCRRGLARAHYRGLTRRGTRRVHWPREALRYLHVVPEGTRSRKEAPSCRPVEHGAARRGRRARFSCRGPSPRESTLRMDTSTGGCQALSGGEARTAPERRDKMPKASPARRSGLTGPDSMANPKDRSLSGRGTRPGHRLRIGVCG